MFVEALPAGIDASASGLAGIGSVIHAMFVSTMGASSADYAATEAINTVAMI